MSQGDNPTELDKVIFNSLCMSFASGLDGWTRESDEANEAELLEVQSASVKAFQDLFLHNKFECFLLI